jgi:heme oxygenase
MWEPALASMAEIRTALDALLTRARADSVPAASMHVRLKLATRLDHRRVDRLMTRYDLGQPETYGAFLSLNFRALTALRPHWLGADESDFAGLIEALAADLAALGMPPSGDVDPEPGPIDGLGLAYVVRGSRLGSKILRKRVGLGLPTEYFGFRLGQPWARFLDELDLCGEAGSQHEFALVSGARETFSVYARLHATPGGLT